MSPYRTSGTTVVIFSGGRTSAYMLHQVLDNDDDLCDLVVTVAKTGKKHPPCSSSSENMPISTGP
ncbi:hypothetical protein [Pseudomonas sp. 11/12A]|uniref:hypothetical protein n=1 Tax=Pseudomonas sp. 11/12A TaxID=1506582 RepID=UPI0009E089FA